MEWSPDGDAAHDRQQPNWRFDRSNNRIDDTIRADALCNPKVMTQVRGRDS